MTAKKTTAKATSPKSPSKRATPAAAPKAAPKAARTAVVVMGMHRSGTSALAGVLARMGCDLPATEMPTTASNTRGFYESNEIYLLNNALLDSAGIDWKDWQPFPTAWTQSPRAPEFAARAAEVFASEFGASSLLVMKDPRICRLFPLWHQVLKDADCAPAIVHTHRNPLEVATSLEDRNQLPKTTGMMIWLRYVLDAEASTRGLPRTFTSYPRLLQNWQHEIDRIEGDLDLVFPSRSAKSIASVDSFLTSDLKHFNYGADDIDQNPMVTAWVRDTYEIMERWAAGRETAAGRKALDKINAAFSSTALIYGPMQENITRATTAELNTKTYQLKKQKTARYERDLKIAALESQITALQGKADEAGDLRAQLEETTRQFQATRTDMGNRITELKSDPGPADDLRAQLEDTTAQLTAARAEVKKLETDASQVDDLRQQLDDTTAALKTTRDEMAGTQSALIQRQHESDEAHKEIQALRAQIDDLKAACAAAEAAPNPDQVSAIAALENALQARDQEIRGYRTEKAGLTGQLQTRYQELSQMAQLIQTLEARNIAADQATQTELQQLRAQTAESARTVSDLETQLLGRQEKQKASAALLETAQADVAKLRKQLTKETDTAKRRKKKQIDYAARAQAEVEKLKWEREYFETALNKVKASTSWRVTGPLRRVVRMIRPGKK